MEIHRLTAVQEEGKAYVEFLRIRDLSPGVSRLPAGATDNQQPHAEEEIYFVVSGRAEFTNGTRNVEVQGGDFLLSRRRSRIVFTRSPKTWSFWCSLRPPREHARKRGQARQT
jgi:hypothetical protein